MKARIPKNFGGMPNNMQSMIQQAQKMQEDITKKQAEIDEMEFTASVGGGAVEVVMSGKKELKAITIKPISQGRNRELLRSVMREAGLVPYRREWWHYEEPMPMPEVRKRFRLLDF